MATPWPIMTIRPPGWAATASETAAVMRSTTSSGGSVTSMCALTLSEVPTSTSTSTPSPSPSPVVVASPSSGLGWVEDLTVSSDLSGTMSVVAPNVTNQQSECSGKNSRGGGNWASTIYVLLGNQKYGVLFLAM